MWKKKKIKRSMRSIVSTYKYYQLFSLTSVGSKYILSLYYMVIYLTIPQRQQYFNFYSLQTSKLYGFSSGILLKIMGYTNKFYKRSYLNSAVLALYFRKYYLEWWTHVYLLVIKNFNYRQIFFLKKLYSLLKVNIYYVLHNRSFIPRFFPKKRIKRRVLRLLGST